MTSSDFNKKYEAYLEKGHYGLSFDDEKVTEYLDEKFQEFIKVPGFSYSQIKLKFGMARFYCTPNTVPTSEVEDKINELINGRK